MIDIAHLLQRLSDPFNTESRFYWPFVAAVLLAAVVHTVWYLRRPTKPRHPVRDQVESIAYWVDLIALIILIVALSAKLRAWMILTLVVIEWAVIGWLYFVYAPPRFEAHEREERRRRFIPEPRRRAARR